MSPTARLVLITLCSYHNPTKAYSFPRQKTLAESTGASLKSVTNAINELRLLGLLMTTGELGDTLKYHFTAKFFELVKITNPCVKNAHGGCVKTADHEQSNFKQINKKSNFNNFNSVQGVIYKTPEQTKQEISKSLNSDKDEKSPYNDKETALNLIEQLKTDNNDISNMIINKLVKLWQIN
jgi:DNA-binding transcriptional MocR family regulator